MRLRWLAGALIGWTLVSLATLVLAGGVVNTPGCARHVSPTPVCQAALEAANEAAFVTHALPIVMVIASGYAAVIGVATVRGRRPR